MSKVVTFRPLTPKESVTWALKCASNANEQSKMQCPRPINTAMETQEDENIEINGYYCNMHALHKKQEMAGAVKADADNYGLKAEDA